MKKILIVDDEEDVVEVLKMALEDAGFQIEGALTGAEGIEKLEKFKPDAVILDIIMEDIDGVSVSKKIPKETKIFVISACDPNTRKAIEKEINSVAWFEKPFEIQEFVEEVKKHL